MLAAPQIVPVAWPSPRYKVWSLPDYCSGLQLTVRTLGRVVDPQTLAPPRPSATNAVLVLYIARGQNTTFVPFPQPDTGTTSLTYLPLAHRRLFVLVDSLTPSLIQSFTQYSPSCPLDLFLRPPKPPHPIHDALFTRCWSGPPSPTKIPTPTNWASDKHTKVLLHFS